jgi:hypothetical protein
MPMFRVIPVWTVGLSILMLVAGICIGRATSSPSQAAQPSSPGVQSELIARRWPAGYHGYDCKSFTCNVDLVGPAGVQEGSSADLAMEVKLDGSQQVEHHDCGPIYEDRVTRCGYHSQGSIFQGGLISTTFSLDNGEHRTLSFRTHCQVPTSNGEVCRWAD